MQSANKNKRVLITGAAGFIGSHLCDRFIAEGYRVIGMDNFLTGSADNIAHLLEMPNFKFIKYDVTEFVYIAESVDIILHFACPASPFDYLKHPIHTMKVDSLGTLNTLGLARNKKARYVFASTSEIYGDPEVHPQKEEYWGNVNSVGPRAVYDEAKRFSEAMTMAYYRVHGIDARIVRIFNTYGTRMRLHDGRVIPNFISQALQNEPITLFGDGKQTRSFCYISDLVAGIYKMATLDGLDSRVINLGNPDEYTIKQLAEIIKRMVGSSADFVYHPLPEDDPRRRKPDITKARQYLDWQPQVSIEDGLKQAITYFEKKLKQNQDS